MSKATTRDLTFTQNRELSWLKFNERVLAEAADTSVPLIERFRFVSIFTSNLDEFFMVRVGSLMDLNVIAPNDVENKSGETPAEQLEAVYAAVRPLIERRDKIYKALNAALAASGVTDVSYDALSDSQRAFVRDYYKENIRPLLSPQIIDRSHPFPHLKNKALYAAALLGKQGKQTLGIVDIPSSLPRLIMLPGDGVQFIRVEEVVAAQLKKTFKIYEVTEHAVVSVTRNADISLDEERYDDDDDYLTYMSRLLKKRDRLAPVRLEVQGKAPNLAKVLMEFLKLDARQVYTSECPLTLNYAYQLDKCPPYMYDAPHAPVYPDYLNKDQPIWDQVAQRDVLLFYPYQSIQPFLDLLRQSAEDPNVISIKITIYRLAHNSAIAKALCAAAENGKEVTVLMELRARFDEQNNIDWTRELEEAGCRILYGPHNCKCHAKICLITRRDRNGLKYVTQIGTGNYNEKTSTLYTDFCMMTADPNLARDAISFFESMLIGDLSGEYERLMVAPNAMKDRILALIDGEIAKGPEGRIRIKANSVTERDLIDKLSEASCAGVKIDLVIRGICCLVPGVPGKTENITVTSVIGRFLEHSRIYAFGTGDDMQIYLSSADVMTRNQVRRVEIAAPVRSAELKEFLSEYLDRILADNTKAWRLGSDGIYKRLTPAQGEEPLTVQGWYLDHPIHFQPSVKPRQSLKSRLQGCGSDSRQKATGAAGRNRLPRWLFASCALMGPITPASHTCCSPSRSAGRRGRRTSRRTRSACPWSRTPAPAFRSWPPRAARCSPSPHRSGWQACST